MNMPGSIFDIKNKICLDKWKFVIQNAITSRPVSKKEGADGREVKKSKMSIEKVGKGSLKNTIRRREER